MKNKIIIFITIIYILLYSFINESLEYVSFFLFLMNILFIVGIVYLKVKKLNYKLPLILIMFFFLVLLCLNLYNNESLFIITNFIAPSIFLTLFLLSLLYYEFKKLRLFTVAIVLIVNIFISFYLFLFMFNYSNYGTYFGTYSQQLTNEIVVKDAIGNLKKLDSNKIYVIDSWNKGCGICFKKFPKFDKLKEKYENNTNIEFIGLNFYKKEDEILNSQYLFNSKDLNFKTYYIQVNEARQLPVTFFPTVLVLKNNKIIFRGHVETLELFSNYYLK